MNLKSAMLVIAVLALAGCAAVAERDARLMDSGLPLSDLKRQYDVLHYTIRTDVLVEEKAIDGSATIRFRAKAPMNSLELHFDGEFDIRSVTRGDAALAYEQTAWNLVIDLGATMAAGEIADVTVDYAGQPVEAENPPWGGGFVWEKTPSGKPWIATAFQGEGCDVWWPCKDHPTGEPLNGVDLFITVPDGLTAASNGVLQSTTDAGDGRTTFHWKTESAINTYGIALNIAPYVLIESSYTSTNGTVVPVQFWAIEDHEAEARELFDREFQDIIDWFEKTVGPYPWGHEKLGIAETPHLGMEHQTINAYGNEFRKDEWGFDWLFHHELAHEWFGNVMTHATVSDMWLHEGFGAYMQALYTRDTWGEAAYYARMFPILQRIRSCFATAPVEEMSDDQLYFNTTTGPGPDIYAKGSWAMHTLRETIGDELFFRAVRILVYGTDRPETLQAPIEARLRSTDDFASIVSGVTGEDMSWFFDAYFRQAALPELAVTETDDGLLLTWSTEQDTDFPMPIDVRIDGELERIEFTDNTALIPEATRDDVLIDPWLDVLRYFPTVPRCDEREDASGG